MPLLTNEERLRRLRERWARQAAERRKERAAPIPALTCGVSVERKERLITPHMMAMAESHFWGKRGINFHPQFNNIPAPVRDRTAQLAIVLGAGS